MGHFPSLGEAYIIAARRSALGKPGGIHRMRRLEALAAPIIEAALSDAGLTPSQVDEIFVGNTTAGGNPARLLALSARLPEAAAALTLDRQCASGLDAIMLGVRAVALGDAQVTVAGGAESISTAPWRIAKPKTLFQTPRFINPEGGSEADGGFALPSLASSERLAQTLGLSRRELDMAALRAHLRAETAREERRFVGEIVPLKVAAEEARDEGLVVPDIDELGDMDPILPDGLHTWGSSASPRDGAAFVVIVAPHIYAALRRPPALRVLAHASQGVSPSEEARAPILALERTLKPNGAAKPTPSIVEMSEASVTQAMALAAAFDLDDDAINPHGGAVARGYPLGAASAVSVVRLFSLLVREKSGARSSHSVGAVAQGAAGGLGVAALFERV